MKYPEKIPINKEPKTSLVNNARPIATIGGINDSQP
jgi:hypothetical protein